MSGTESSKSDDDDAVELSSSALAALHQFYNEQADKYNLVKEVLEKPEKTSENVFEEDWQLSQFWYDSETALTLAEEAVRCAGEDGRICLVSCPTVYGKIKSLCPNAKVTLLEYDQRFSIYNGYIFYDYKKPLELPQELFGAFDVVLADPPFLSEECLSKTSETIKFLAKDKIILCTGAIMEDQADQLLKAKISKFKPGHGCNLANEFRCFANYNIDNYLKMNK